MKRRRSQGSSASPALPQEQPDIEANTGSTPQQEPCPPLAESDPGMRNVLVTLHELTQ